MSDIHETEKRTDLAKIASIQLQHTTGAVKPQTVAELVRMAEMYSRAGVMVPPHCRDKIGTCYALCEQALTWGFPPLAVINQSYVVNNRGVDRISYQSQMLHAVIEKNAPLKGRLRYVIKGEGDERRCVVSGTFKGEVKPHEYESETLGKLRDARGRNEQGQLRGSPLWDHQPDVQLFYSASRQWARLFCPDILLGVSALDDAQYDDATPNITALTQRLKDKTAAHATARGFDPKEVAAVAGTIIEGAANPGQQEADHHEDAEGSPSGHRDEADRSGDVGAGADLQSDRREADDRGDPQRDEKPASDDTASSQAEIFPPDRQPAPKGKGKRR